MSIYPARPRPHHGSQRGTIVQLDRIRANAVQLPRRQNVNPIPQGSNRDPFPFDVNDDLYPSYGEGNYGEGYYGE